jgi:methionyl-tRNA formyltransferase
MQMDKGLDTGDMLHKSIIPILNTDTGQTIHDVLARKGATDIVYVLNTIVEKKERLLGEIQATDKATYAHKLTKEEANIDWANSANHIDCKVRAFTPRPTAYTYYHGKPMKIHHTSVKENITKHIVTGKVIHETKVAIEVSTGQGTLLIHRLQMPGKRAMDVRSFLNGHSLKDIIF